MVFFVFEAILFCMIILIGFHKTIDLIDRCYCKKILGLWKSFATNSKIFHRSLFEQFRCASDVYYKATRARTYKDPTTSPFYAAASTCELWSENENYAVIRMSVCLSVDMSYICLSVENITIRQQHSDDVVFVLLWQRHYFSHVAAIISLNAILMMNSGSE